MFNNFSIGKFSLFLIKKKLQSTKTILIIPNQNFDNMNAETEYKSDEDYKMLPDQKFNIFYTETEYTSMSDEDFTMFAEVALMLGDDDMDTNEHSETTTIILRSSQYETSFPKLDTDDGDADFVRDSLVRTSSSFEHSLFNDMLLSSDSIVEISVAPHDVLIGQSPNLRDHHGNQKLRRQVQFYKEEYFDKDTKKCRKTEIARSILESIRVNGGRFLRRSRSTGIWTEEDDKTKQHEIVASRFRGLKKSIGL